jgi:hypothetical protein
MSLSLFKLIFASKMNCKSILLKKLVFITGLCLKDEFDNVRRFLKTELGMW